MLNELFQWSFAAASIFVVIVFGSFSLMSYDQIRQCFHFSSSFVLLLTSIVWVSVGWQLLLKFFAWDFCICSFFFWTPLWPVYSPLAPTSNPLNNTNTWFDVYFSLGQMKKMCEQQVFYTSFFLRLLCFNTFSDYFLICQKKKKIRFKKYMWFFYCKFKQMTYCFPQFFSTFAIIVSPIRPPTYPSDFLRKK